MAATGFNFSGFGTGNTSTSSNTTLGFGTSSTQSGPLNFSTTQSSFNMPTTSTAAPTGGLTFGAATSSAAPTFGTPASSTASFGLSLPKPAVTTGFSLGATTSASSTTAFGTFGTATASKPAFPTLGGTATTSTSLTLGPAFGTTPASAAKGLGGVDPQQTIVSSGTGVNNGKPSDGKALKETNVPNEIVSTVENFKKFTKDQKTVREDIARMSSKPIYKVQEDIQVIRQMLAVVSNGIQRNAGAIIKLKTESSQEAKNIEIALRTRDTPPGLQYENTAPTEYFQRLVEEFEVRMQLYRQQIDNIESHFASLNQQSVVTPQDMTILLRKLHETFIALAAHLQVVHESVKEQKEHHLNYRKVFHGETSNVFESRQRVAEKTGLKPPLIKKTIFMPSVESSLAKAKSAALSAQQAASNVPTQNLTSLGAGLQSTSTLGLGSSIGFGAQANQQNSTFQLGANNTSLQFGATTPLGGFQLQKPPTGAKRGKTK